MFYSLNHYGRFLSLNNKFKYNGLLVCFVGQSESLEEFFRFFLFFGFFLSFLSSYTYSSLISPSSYISFRIVFLSYAGIVNFFKFPPVIYSSV